jgi:hypothetical protein
VSDTVRGAVATWRLRDSGLQRRQVATAPRTVPPPINVAINPDEGAMRNNKFVKIVIWIIILLVVVGLALPVFTSFFGF